MVYGSVVPPFNSCKVVPHSQLSWFITPITRVYGSYIMLYLSLLWLIKGQTSLGGHHLVTQVPFKLDFRLLCVASRASWRSPRYTLKYVFVLAVPCHCHHGYCSTKIPQCSKMGSLQSSFHGGKCVDDDMGMDQYLLIPFLVG